MKSRLDEEKEIFRNLSTNKDYELVMKEEEIRFVDFDRLMYILNTLELTSLGIYFFDKHCEKFEKQLKELDKLNREYGSYIDMSTINNWLTEFAKNIKDSKEKERIINLFRI